MLVMKKVLSSLFLHLQGKIQDMLSLSFPFCHTHRDRRSQGLRSVCCQWEVLRRTVLAQSKNQYRCALSTGEIFLSLQQRHLQWGLQKGLRALGAQIPSGLRWNWGPCCLWFCCTKCYMHECTSLMSPAITCPQISDNSWNNGLTSSWSRAF